MSILVDELVHFSLALGVGLFFYYRQRQWQLVVAALLFGFLIDVDHLFDYFSYFGFQFRPADFFDVDTYMKPSGKVYVLLHGWEYLFIFGFLGKWWGRKKKIKDLSLTISLAYFLHLVWDFLPFYRQPLSYFFLFRLVNKFSLEKFLFFRL